MVAPVSRYKLPRWQGLVGLLLAFAIVGSWLGIHAFTMFVFELTWSNLPWAFGLAALQCWLSVGLFIVSHDAMHGSLAPGRQRLSAAIGAFVLFVYAGFGWKKMRDAHFAHHKHAGTEQDPDFDAHHPRSFWRWYTTFFLRYFGWQSVAFITLVVLTYWLVLGISMAQLTVLYAVPSIASSLQLFYFGTYRPHTHTGSAFADGHNARSEQFGTLASLASCFHFGYHLEHHRRPDVPWWALPAARRQGVAR